jgi:hypothetical protein
MCSCLSGPTSCTQIRAEAEPTQNPLWVTAAWAVDTGRADGQHADDRGWPVAASSRRISSGTRPALVRGPGTAASPGQVVSRNCRGWVPCEEPSHGQYLSLHLCPARLLSRMTGLVPGADGVQGAAGQRVMTWLPAVGGGAGGERWRRWPGVVGAEVRAGAPGRSR